MKSSKIQLVILPRKSMSWSDFVSTAPAKSIALDGVVQGGPKSDLQTKHINFDHHDCVVREATMSTAMQALFAIKGGLMDLWMKTEGDISVYVNDPDQDTSFAVWLLMNYKKFEGVQGIPHINRLLALNDRWDITGGAFPMNLDDALVRQHAWVFQPYSQLRKSGALSSANEVVIGDNLAAVMRRLDAYMMGQGEEIELDTRHTILFDSLHFKIVDEIGGNEARYLLFSKGMNAYISLVATRPDGRKVWSVGRRSQYIQFPVRSLYADFNQEEKLDLQNGWNGSDLVGGSSRLDGSGLGWERLSDITLNRLRMDGII